ncbi:MAG: four helix bundle protein [bacterium]|nr:four helix bundle protein [bacterium]
MINNDPIRNFKDLIAWQEGHKLVKTLYLITKTFPRDEVFGLISQIKRAAVSVTSNLAEGFARETYKDKVRFYYIARGSVIELENQLLIAKDVGYLSDKDFHEADSQIQTVQSLINGLIKKSKTFI